MKIAITGAQSTGKSTLLKYLKKDEDLKGFEFIDFVNLCRWERNDYLNTFGHCTYGDALFLRAPEKIDFENISEDKFVFFNN